MSAVENTVDIPSPGRPTTRVGAGGFIGALAAEWTKTWSVRAPYICLTAGAAATGVFTFYYASIARINDVPLQPVGNAPVTSLLLVQFAIVVLAMTAVTSEYATSSVRASLLWVPVRHRMHLAKTVMAAAVAAVAGILYGVSGIAVAWTPFRGHATFDPAKAAVQVLTMALYCAAVAVLTVGVAFALRASAGVLTVVFVLLSAIPSVLTGLGGEVLLTINDYLPQTAGTHLMRGEPGAPYPPAVAALILLSWALAAHLAGRAVLRGRDA
ncbi:ABC transporter permease [Streptomyces sp. NPDC051000]|uniref:ABC transporter permease n=1 Tax=Streptomyces sp. NPDC051000 TaxID=3155520 RepID=UPI0033CA3FED